MTPRYNRAKEMTPSSGINRTTVEDPGIPASQRRILADRATETLSRPTSPQRSPQPPNLPRRQVKAFRLMVNRSVSWADCDLDALAMEFGELKALVFDLTLTGFGFAGDRRLHTSIKFSRR